MQHVFQLTWNKVQGWPMSVLSLQWEGGWGKDYVSGYSPPLRLLAGWVGRPAVWDQGVWDGCSPSHCSFLNAHQRAQAAWHMYEGPTEEKGWHSWEGRMHENSEQRLWKGKEVETKCCRASVAMRSPTLHLFLQLPEALGVLWPAIILVRMPRPYSVPVHCSLPVGLESCAS